jgi:L-seryl-tRNA(Ser) seleniumtransferase
MNKVLDFCQKQLSQLSRRELFRNGGMLAAAGLLSTISRRAMAAPLPAASRFSTTYQSLGVRPLINARGTITVISGSLIRPEVKLAMEEASLHYVQLDELMDAVGKRLAELTGAEWGIVTAGCSAAVAHATSACIAGANPDKIVRLPNLNGLKDEVIMPRYSRNVYDHAVRSLGVRVTEVETREQFTAALGPRTAMVMVLAGAAANTGPLSLEEVAILAKAQGVPVLVDAANEGLTYPDVHLKRGATMVAYSGGNAFLGHNAPGCCWGAKTWFGLHGSTVRRTTHLVAR